VRVDNGVLNVSVSESFVLQGTARMRLLRLLLGRPLALLKDVVLQLLDKELDD